MLRRIGILFALCAAAVGCGEQTPSAAPRILRFSASPAKLPVGGGPVILMWDVADASFATLVDNQALPTSGSLQVKLDEDASFTLTAHGEDGKTASATISVRVERIEVSGTVVDEAGLPAAGIEVRVNGGPPVLTDEDGAWSGGEVYAPWSARLHDPTGARVDQLYLGITRKTGILPLGLPTKAPPQNRSGHTLTLAWTGGVEAAPDAFTDVVVLGNGDVWSTRIAAGESGTVEVPIELAGAETQDIDVVLLQSTTYLDGSTVRTSWQRFAWSPNVTLSMTAPLDVGTLNLQPVRTREVTLGIESGGKWLDEVCATPRLIVSGRAPWRMPTTVCVPSLDVPLDLISLPIVVNFEASLVGHGGELTPGSGNRPRAAMGYVTLGPDDRSTIPLPFPPTLSARTDLVWYAHAGYCRAALDGTRTIDVWTDRSWLDPKLLARAGVELIPGDYSWQVSCYSSPITVDDALANPTFLRDTLDGRFGGQYASSAIETFRR